MFEGKRSSENYKREMERKYIKLSTKELIVLHDRIMKTASIAGNKDFSNYVNRKEDISDLRSFLDKSIIELDVIKRIVVYRERDRMEEVRRKHKNKRHRRFI